MSTYPSSLRTRLLREPLFHFAALGLLLLAVYRLATPPGSVREIVISQAVVQGLREDYHRRNGALPSADEQAGLVQRYIDNEILYREALALGLDRGDVIVRRRLIQKMEFLAEQLGSRADPSEAELNTFLQDHASSYAIPSRFSFEHVFLRHDDTAKQRALEAKQALDTGVAPGSIGDPFLRGRSFVLLSAPEIAGIFGDEFASALRQAPDNTWSGPIRSAYGEHVVRITARQAESAPKLADVREPILRAWKESQQEQAVKQELQRLRRHYTIIGNAGGEAAETP